MPESDELTDSGHGRRRVWPGMLDQQVEDDRQVVDGDGQRLDPADAFDRVFYHGTRE